ncbi:flagellar hook-length control protein FliK [Sphingomonas ginkgonis]|uniref:Flagellar hook-length control protein FliK n=1 Tax=Sphingomonas ginkgonis TaxID=2315330 RepID=A0A429VC38_9SPHN|nr:flagellar hook-length control protein FliK [Sphingomonas ginkgonis]RST31565.1 flagellar hook-length control protein FliK [Sphingomonas ginkgonis]
MISLAATSALDPATVATGSAGGAAASGVDFSALLSAVAPAATQAGAPAPVLGDMVATVAAAAPDAASPAINAAAPVDAAAAAATFPEATASVATATGQPAVTAAPVAGAPVTPEALRQPVEQSGAPSNPDASAPAGAALVAIRGRTSFTLAASRPVRLARSAVSRSDEEASAAAQPSPAALLTLQQTLAAVGAFAASPKPTPAASPTAEAPAPGSTPIATAPTLPAMAAQQASAMLPTARPARATSDAAGGEEKGAVAPLGSHPLSHLLPATDLAPLLPPDAPVPAPAADKVAAPAAVPLPVQVDKALAENGTALHQLDALVRDIAEISGASGRAAFRLAADQLGPLEVRLHAGEAGMSVSIKTETAQSHSTVAQAQQQLGDDLRASGLKVAATSVMLEQGGTDRQRQERAASPPPVRIEVAVPGANPERDTDQQRPAGRYA